MTHDQLRLRMRQSPFQPFRVVLNSGRSFEIWHRHAAMVTVPALHIGLPTDPDSDRHESAFYTGYCQIARIEEIHPISSDGNA